MDTALPTTPNWPGQKSQLTWLWMPVINAIGVEQMALDEALLHWVQEQTTPYLIARLYTWQTPTLSLGVHQSPQSIAQAYQQYSARMSDMALVRRPTGGRAILHGEDISYAFVTNVSDLLKLSVENSYCVFATWIRRALENASVPLTPSCSSDKRGYTRSALCFETHTPSDLLAQDGKKVSGAAQLRRQGGLLHHGAAFLKPYGLDATPFEAHLKAVMQADLQRSPSLLDIAGEPALQAKWTHFKTCYTAEVETIWAKLSTTSGSHLVPASD